MLFMLSVLIALIALVAWSKLAKAGRGDALAVAGASRAGAGLVGVFAALVALSQMLTDALRSVSS